MLDEVGVVAHVGAGGAQVDDGARLGRLLAQVMDVRHHVVAKLALQLGRALQVEVVQVRADRLDGRVGNGKPQLALRFRQRQPEPAPRPELELR